MRHIPDVATDSQRMPHIARRCAISRNVAAYLGVLQHIQEGCAIRREVATYRRKIQHIQGRCRMPEGDATYLRTVRHIPRRCDISPKVATYRGHFAVSLPELHPSGTEVVIRPPSLAAGETCRKGRLRECPARGASRSAIAPEAAATSESTPYARRIEGRRASPGPTPG